MKRLALRAAIIQDEDLLNSELVRELLRFDHVFKDVSYSFAPHKLVKYLDDLSKSFNRFYASEQVLTGDLRDK